jgi:glutamate-1-semialdehyde aminotransferase
MAAGKATLEALTEDVFQAINDSGDQIRERLREICSGLPLSITGAGPFYKVNATSRTLSDYRDAVTIDKEWERLASLAMLNEGFLLTSTMRGCVSTATTEDQISGFLAAFSDLLQQ